MSNIICEYKNTRCSVFDEADKKLGCAHIVTRMLCDLCLSVRDSLFISVYKNQLQVWNESCSPDIIEVAE